MATGLRKPLRCKGAHRTHDSVVCRSLCVGRQPSEQTETGCVGTVLRRTYTPSIAFRGYLWNSNRPPRVVEYTCSVIMSESLNEDSELAALRAKCYRGIVKAPLDALDFDHPLVVDKRREISEQNVQRLERIFERNGCLRLQEENVINAVVLDEDLPLLLSSGVSALTPEQLRQIAWARDAPALGAGKLKCISGLHRIQAAKRYLDENDKWWPVRLFSAGTNYCCISMLIPAYECRYPEALLDPYH
jgi:hypothetical protein